MSGLVESATSIMISAQRRLDITSRNIANVSTPGFKRRLAFSNSAVAATISPSMIESRLTTAQGRLESTDNPLDLAINGEGYFRVRCADQYLYTRQGLFRRNADGLLVTPQGYALQQAGGGDVVVEREMLINPDGVVLAAGLPVARVALERPISADALTPVGESFFVARDPGMMVDAEAATLRAGMLESSNVSLGEEMIQSMLAVREAESGARLIRVYDDLMGRVATTLAQGAGR